jgi:hypothetical protein
MRFLVLITICFLNLIQFKIDSAIIKNNNDEILSTEFTTTKLSTTAPNLKPWPANSTVCYEYVGKFDW